MYSVFSVEKALICEYGKAFAQIKFVIIIFKLDKQ